MELAKIFESRLKVETGIPWRICSPDLVNWIGLHKSVENRDKESEMAARPGGNKPSADPYTLPHCPSYASVLLLPCQEAILPSLLISFSPVNISSVPSDQEVPFL